MKKETNQKDDSGLKAAANATPSSGPATLTETDVETEVPETPALEPKRLEVTFSDHPDLKVEICLADGANVEPESISCTLHQTCNTRASFFTTSNFYGQHLLPGLLSTYCPHCDSTHRQFIDPIDTTVHVVTDSSSESAESFELDDATTADLDEQIEQKVRRRWYGYGNKKKHKHGKSFQQGWEDNNKEFDPWADTSGNSGNKPVLPDSQKRGKLAPYLIVRNGRLLRTISAPEMEKLAAENETVAIAMGWGAPADDEETTSDESSTDTTE